jgi:hypothetical protein
MQTLCPDCVKFNNMFLATSPHTVHEKSSTCFAQVRETSVDKTVANGKEILFNRQLEEGSLKTQLQTTPPPPPKFQ